MLFKYSVGTTHVLSKP